MAATDAFRRMFQGASLEVEDLLLLESFQIGLLPGWVPEREFAAVLWAYPAILRFLETKHPPVAALVERVTAQFGPAADEQELASFADELVWTIADLLVYNKCPEIYDALAFHDWDFREVTAITSLEGKRVVDAGAGTGRVALEAAVTAREVFAVEPVARLRQFVRHKASAAGLDNLYVLDGFLHAIPLPGGFVDALITSHALGWCLEDELREFERVVRPEGHVIHCPGTADTASEEEQHACLISPEWGYEFSRYREADGWKRKYWKQLPVVPHREPLSSESRYTSKQGQYLAYIYHYTRLHGQPPAEADMQHYFRVTPPSVHQMVLRLEERGLISREPGRARSVRVLLPVEELPHLEGG
jgi:ubiquinone/menaquinone biosynthesis C-methylase UbiE